MFCKDLKDQAMKIINYEKKEMIPLTDEEKETHENQKICYKCEQEFCADENNKKEFQLKMTSLSQSINEISEINNKISQIDKKEPDNKFIDSIRSMMTSLSLSIDKVSEIDNKLSQIDKKETENKFTDNMRSMINSLSQSIDKVSEIDKKISHAALIEKFYNTYQLCDEDLNKFTLLLRKGVYPYEYMVRWKRATK